MAVNPDPPLDCPRCPRLVDFRHQWGAKQPDWWNAPVEGWGDPAAWLLIVGLAPGLRGANRTGRPFTGDYAGALLYATLAKFGLSTGVYAGHRDDGLRLTGAFIANAAACVPPGNKPTPDELRNCRPFLDARVASLPKLKVMIALGKTAHESVVRVIGARQADHPFGHGARHGLPNGVTLIDSYHCSRLNTNTGKLTPAMFERVFAEACAVGQPAS